MATSSKWVVTATYCTRFMFTCAVIPQMEAKIVCIDSEASTYIPG